MSLYRIYVAQKKKDGTVVKSEPISTAGDTKEHAIERAVSAAKKWYGYRGKVHICSVWIRVSMGRSPKYEKI